MFPLQLGFNFISTFCFPNKFLQFFSFLYIYIYCTRLEFDPIQSTVGIQDKDAVGQPNFSRHTHTHTRAQPFSWQRKTLSVLDTILHYFITLNYFIIIIIVIISRAGRFVLYFIMFCNYNVF